MNILNIFRFIVLIMLNRGGGSWLRDEKWLKIYYWAKTGKKLHLNPPLELNEKMQWLKLHDRNDLYTILVDKCEVKNYVKSIIGEQYIIPTIHTWDSVDDIDFDVLPNSFVLKCNHNSRIGLCICRDKSKLLIKKVIKELNKGFNDNYYLHGREWPYKNVKKKILCEQYLENDDGSPIVDYKFYCFGGKPVYFMYSVGEAKHDVKNHKFNMNLESIDFLFKQKEAISRDEIKLPDNIDEMIKIVTKLCRGFKHIRVDLYNVNGKIFFGEMTLYSGSGFFNILSREYSNYLANLIKI